ncbi:hypothetical protein D3C81_728900 [compost metagenome]
MFGRLLRIVPKRDISRSEFQDLLKDIFGENALENCFYDRKVRGFAYKYKWTNNKLSVTVFSNLYLGNRHKEVELKAVFKHDKSNNTIKLCYIEKCNHSSLDYSIEAINSIKKYYHNALENEYQGPKITFNKQYESVIKKAVEKKYIDKTIVK